MEAQQVALTPRWCDDDDILKGWVVIHSRVTEKLGLRHLNHIQLKCLDTGKTTYCRIYGPGSKPYRGNTMEVVQSSIFLDAHYQQRLNLTKEQMSGKDSLRFEITKASLWGYAFKAAWHHPDDGVRVGAILGLVSLMLGAISLVLGGISVWLTVCPVTQ